MNPTIGTKVKLRAKDACTELGIAFRRRGGEGEIVGILTDARGEYYSVRLLHSGRTHYARRSDLVVHRG